MFLKSLSLKGFKSFADPAVLEFEPGITVVVGPNGSGKSNVVDAVAWVLGAQGPRSLRSAKMEDVIFMGTANRPSLGRAEVALTIDNSAGKLATDLAEITITRTLFRSGDSEYAINGAPCRLLDIQELLSDTGVGRQQHVIISQGHLDAILEARPEDRRAVIEEAAGVLKYRRRRERSERRLAATEENLERLFDLVREVKRQIRPLERQAAAARSYTGLADELKAVRLHVAGTELAALDDRHRRATGAQAELLVTEAQLQASLSELDADTERTADEMSAQRESDLAAGLGRAEGMVERARGLAGVLRERQRSLALALDAAADADVVSTLEAESARLTEELETTEAEAATLAPEHDEVAMSGATAAAELERHLEAWGDGTELRLADEAVTVARGQLGSLEHALERDRRALDQLAARLATSERRATLLAGEEGELGQRLAELEDARRRLQTTVAETEAVHAEAVSRLEVAEEALRQAEQELHRSTARADALERAFDEARGAAGAELLAGVDGVVGTLLDVVEVDPGWEHAFEAAAGASVAAVVVSGREPARAALSRLRQGGATGAVLALTDAGLTGEEPEAPPGTESIRDHVRPHHQARDLPGLEVLLDRLLARSSCAPGGWSEAIDVALARPDLVIVTRDGDRFSSAGWRVRAAGGAVTAAVVEEARARAEQAAVTSTEVAAERAEARAAVEATRLAAGEAVRSDDRNEAAHQTARVARQRVADDLAVMAAELEEIDRQRQELDERIARDAGRAAALRDELPGLEANRVDAAERAVAARQERRRIDERIAEAARLRSEWEVRSAGLVERRRVLDQRWQEVERRLTGHADERRQAAERRQRLEAGATAVGRLQSVVGSAEARLQTALAELRERHRLQLEAVRAGGARLEELRRQRSALEHELAAVRGRLQKVEVDLVEADIRRESVVESLRRELASTPEEALDAPTPDIPEGTDPMARVEQLERELAAIGPVNPLALEELSELHERHQFLESQVDDVRVARRELHHVIRTLDEEIMHVFDAAFADVNEHFSNLVTSLFPGGTGRLSLTDPENLLDTGVEVEVRPAGRNVRRLSLLSGGERSLVALAYLFAVFRSRPSPFYMMDEVEAALDDVNLQRFLGLVHEFRGEAQLIVVSHQKRTMEAADALYGVTMAPGGSSKVVSQRVPRPDTVRPDTDVVGPDNMSPDTDNVGPDSENGAGPEPQAVPDGLEVGSVGRVDAVSAILLTSWFGSVSASLVGSSDVVTGLVVAIPVLIVAGGVAVGLRLRGKGVKDRVPTGEVASDAPTDIELARGAEATRRAEPAPAPPEASTATAAPEAPVAPPEAAAPIAPPEPAPPTVPAGPVEPAVPAEPASFRSRLGKARGLLSGYLGSVRSKGKIDASTWDDLEEALIRADVGVGATDGLLDDLRARVKSGEIVGPDALVDALKSDLVTLLSAADATLAMPSNADEVSGPGGPGGSGGSESPGDAGDDRPVDVWLFVGVNGVGKTTTVGKVASRMAASGARVLLAAGDTFRAAAGEQLSMWASRADADIVRGAEGGDPSSVVFDAVQRAASKGHGVVLADTAGRLHNKVNLIEELKKIRRVADRPPGRVREVLLVLDATTGQNGLAQAKVFLEAVEVSGVVLTKLDGTAKGGIVIAIQSELGLPVKLVGLGEAVGDLVDFDPVAFVDALF